MSPTNFQLFEPTINVIKKSVTQPFIGTRLTMESCDSLFNSNLILKAALDLHLVLDGSKTKMHQTIKMINTPEKIPHTSVCCSKSII